MLGSAVALRRGEHMRLELGRYRMAEATRQALSTFATVVTAAFAAFMLLPSWRYLVNQLVIETPGARHLRRVARRLPADVGSRSSCCWRQPGSWLRARSAPRRLGSLAVVAGVAAALWAGQGPSAPRWAT